MGTAFRLTPGTVVEDVDGTVVLLGEDGDAAIPNAQARVIVDMLEGGKGVDEIAAKLAEDYDVGPKTAREDTAALIDELIAHGLAEVTG